MRSAVLCPRRPSPLPDASGAPVVGIAGVGLIGGSIGLRSRELGQVVIGWDPDPVAVATGLRRGALSTGAASLRALSEAVDILVLAGPVDATLANLAELIRDRCRAALILDVGSVKGPLARAGEPLAAFVPTHPLAGTESSGAEAARAGLFAGRTWTYDPAVRPPARELVLRFIAGMGSEAFPIESDAHDRLVALTSHLPQILSVALGAHLGSRLADPATEALCGSGMRSMLRLATSSFSMWEPILVTNALPLSQEVRALAAILTSAARALERGDTDELGSLFEAAAIGVAGLRANADAGVDVRSGKTVQNER